MASITIVAVIVPDTVITPGRQSLTGPSSMGGTYVRWLAPGAAQIEVERADASGAPEPGAPQPASAACFIDLSLRNGLATIDLLRRRAARCVAALDPPRWIERYPG